MGKNNEEEEDREGRNMASLMLQAQIEGFQKELDSLWSMGDEQKAIESKPLRNQIKQARAALEWVKSKQED